MARARNIKHAFFLNTDLSEVSPLARLAFIGMWTLADYKGCIECNFKKIKAQILPYDNCDIEELSNNLEQYRFIRYYVIQGKRYIKILNFEKHQNPHKNERDAGSSIPDYEEPENISNEINELTKDGTKTEQCQINDEALALIPDSLFLIPDSLIPDSKTLVISDANNLPIEKEKKQDCPHQEIIDLYHKTLPMCPEVKAWTSARQTQLRARWNEDKRRQNLEYWQKFFEYVATCDFLVGRTQKPFFANLEWITNSKNFTKIREQNYENR